jgi:hypothetical protein
MSLENRTLMPMSGSIGHSVRVKYDRLWGRLIESLNTWTSATETGSGQIEAVLPNSGSPARRALILMTPDEWDEMASVAFGGFDYAFEDVKRTLSGLRPDERYAVYADYRLNGSTAPTLPEPPEFTPEPGGEWVAYGREGRIVSRLADVSEPD